MGGEGGEALPGFGITLQALRTMIPGSGGLQGYGAMLPAFGAAFRWSRMITQISF